MKEKYDNDPGNNEVRFQYACALSKSGGIHAETDKREAISHFDFLVQNGVFVRDSLFNLALTEYFLADYEFARVHCEDLYRQDPDNKQVLYISLPTCVCMKIILSLFTNIDKEYFRDMYPLNYIVL